MMREKTESFLKSSRESLLSDLRRKADVRKLGKGGGYANVCVGESA